MNSSVSLRAGCRYKSLSIKISWYAPAIRSSRQKFGISDLLVQAGLKARPAAVSHRSRGIGHSGRRKINALSFHSLRRTATTLLHEAGVPSTVAQALIGHDSAEVHSDYITVGREALRNAVKLFPTP